MAVCDIIIELRTSLAPDEIADIFFHPGASDAAAGLTAHKAPVDGGIVGLGCGCTETG